MRVSGCFGPFDAPVYQGGCQKAGQNYIAETVYHRTALRYKLMDSYRHSQIADKA